MPSGPLAGPSPRPVWWSSCEGVRHKEEEGDQGFLPLEFIPNPQDIPAKSRVAQKSVSSLD